MAKRRPVEPEQVPTDDTNADWTLGDRSFAKLYGHRLAQSSLLETRVATRWVFLFVLSQADAEGRYRCQTIQALARVAAVSVEDAQFAIDELTAPDPVSGTKAHEGRRLLPIPGGWLVVNRARFREIRTLKQIRTAERVKKHREAVAKAKAEQAALSGETVA